VYYTYKYMYNIYLYNAIHNYMYNTHEHIKYKNKFCKSCLNKRIFIIQQILVYNINPIL